MKRAEATGSNKAIGLYVQRGTTCAVKLCTPTSVGREGDGLNSRMIVNDYTMLASCPKRESTNSTEQVCRQRRGVEQYDWSKALSGLRKDHQVYPTTGVGCVRERV